MDDFEHPTVRRVRAPFSLFEKRCARGCCPQCGKKVSTKVYCSEACDLRAENGLPVLPETDEEKKL